MRQQCHVLSFTDKPDNVMTLRTGALEDDEHASNTVNVYQPTAADVTGKQVAAWRSRGSTGFSGSNGSHGWGGKMAKCSASSVEKLTWATDLSEGARWWSISLFCILFIKKCICVNEWKLNAIKIFFQLKEIEVRVNNGLWRNFSDGQRDSLT